MTKKKTQNIESKSTDVSTVVVEPVILPEESTQQTDVVDDKPEVKDESKKKVVETKKENTTEQKSVPTESDLTPSMDLYPKHEPLKNVYIANTTFRPW